MKDIKVVFVACLTLFHLQSTYAQTAYGGYTAGIPIYANLGENYLVLPYYGIMGRLFFDTKHQFEVGPFVHYNQYQININKVYSSINNTSDFMTKTSAFHSSFMFGPAIKFEKKLGKFGLFYGGSLGFSSIQKNTFETTFYPSDTIAAGYSYEKVALYGDGFFSSYGYYIMPTFDFYYKIIDRRIGADHLDLRLNIGFHCYYRDGIEKNIFSTQNSNQVSPVKLKYSQNLSSIGTGIQLGLAIVW